MNSGPDAAPAPAENSGVDLVLSGSLRSHRADDLHLTPRRLTVHGDVEHLEEVSLGGRAEHGLGRGWRSGRRSLPVEVEQTLPVAHELVTDGGEHRGPVVVPLVLHGHSDGDRRDRRPLHWCIHTAPLIDPRHSRCFCIWA